MRSDFSLKTAGLLPKGVATAGACFPNFPTFQILERRSLESLGNIPKFSLSFRVLKRPSGADGNEVYYGLMFFPTCRHSDLLGCGSFVRGRKRKKGDSIPFILSRRDYMSRLHGE